MSGGTEWIGDAWVPNPDSGESEPMFLPAMIVRKDGARTAVQLDHSCDEKLLENEQVHSMSKDGDAVEDLVDMTTVNEATVLDCVRRRAGTYTRMPESAEGVYRGIYTWLSTILIAVNPYERGLDLYKTSWLHKYQDSAIRSPPHVYCVASAANEGAKSKLNQAIVISGESGAGKTETTKRCIQFITDGLSDKRQGRKRKSSLTFAGVGAGASMEDKIMSTNPILEAFGNAKTERNDNSSRFGKWMKVPVLLVFLCGFGAGPNQR